MERGKSFGGLIAWLVDKVAIRGKSGALQEEIIADVQEYYAQVSDHEQALQNNETSSFWSPSDKPPTLDKPFLAYVLQALIRHPEIHVDEQEHPGEGALATEASNEPADIISRQIPPRRQEGMDARSIRIVASETQIWRAIAGHEPDLTRVPGLDFGCLSIIAACGPKGITQLDLIRISGQDKRSLPMRTDRLHKTGYIVKEPVDLVLNKSLVHTSLLFLKRFAESSKATATEITERAWSTQGETKSQKRRLKATKAAQALIESKEKQDDLLENTGEVNGNAPSHDLSEARPVAQWTPDRNIVNQIFDAVNRFGLSGATQNDLFGILMGSDYKKPIEELLAKLTSAWQVSQPLHLRHLALVKDSVLRNKNLVYIYYTYENYKKLVESGQKTWEAISSLQDKAIMSNSSNIPVVQQHPTLDEYGFPDLDVTQFEGQNNDASLRECIQQADRFASSSAGTRLFKRLRRKERTDLSDEEIMDTANASTPSQATSNNGRKRATVIEDMTPISAEPLRENELNATDKGKPNTTIVRKRRGRPHMDEAFEIWTGTVDSAKTSRKKGSQIRILPESLSDQEYETPVRSSRSTRALGLQSVGTRKRRLPKAFEDSITFPGATIKRPRVREESEDLISAKTSCWVLPSVAAHSQPHYAAGEGLLQLQPPSIPQKRVRSLDSPEDIVEAISETPSKRPKITSNLEGNASVLPTSLSQNSWPSNPSAALAQSATPSPRTFAGTRHDLMGEKYAKAANSMEHPDQGVVISKVASRYRRRDDPPYVKTMTYQLAIFKLSALRGLQWFISDNTSSGPAGSPNPRRLEQSDDLGASANQKHPDLREAIVSGSGPATNRDTTLDADLEAGVEKSSNVLAATPEISNPKDSRKTQTPNPDTLGEPLVDSLSASHQQFPSSATGQSEHISSPGSSEDSDASEAVSILSVADPSSQPDQNRIPSLQKISDNTQREETGGIGLETRSPGTAHTRQEMTGLRQEPPNALSTATVSAQTAAVSDEPYFVASQNIPAVREDTFSNGGSHSQNPPKKLVPGKTGQPGGSTAMLRRDIVIDIVGKCGGVFPEAKAMRIPFGNEWKVRGQPGVPDRITVGRTVNMCCEQGKLRRIVFSFKDNAGVTATATVFALPEVDAGDPRISEMQEMIKQRHPQTFFPDAVLPERIQTPHAKKVAAKESMINEARATASKSQEERGAYLTSLKASGRSERDKNMLSRLAESKAPRVERLISIRRPIQPFPASSRKPVKSHLREGLIEGSKNSSLHKSTHAEQNLNVNQSPSAQSDVNGIPYSPLSGRNHNYNQTPPQAQGTGKLQTARQGTKRVTISEEHDTMIRPSLQRDTSTVQTPSDYIIENPIPSHSSALRVRSHAEDHDLVFPGFMDPVHSFHRASGTFFASFAGFRLGQARSSSRGKRRYNQKPVVPVGYVSPFSSKATAPSTMSFPGVMSTQNFHELSGTFSSTFLGFDRINVPRPKRKYTRKNKGLEALFSQTPRRAKRRRENSMVEVDEDDLTVNEKPSKSGVKRRRRAQPTKDRKALDEGDGSPTPLIGNPVRFRKVRGPQPSTSMGENGALRLFVAVTVVRVLTGGVRRHIDWSLVARAFLPEFDEAFIRHRWSAVLSKMKNHQVKMDEDFQALFLKAYEEGTVPQIDFNNLEKYDWKWLVEWTMKRLDTPATSAPHLLADRTVFDSQYALKDDAQEKDLAHYFEFEGFSVQELRYSVINRYAFTCPLFPKASSPNPDEEASKSPSADEQVAIARSWIRANIITPPETYDSQRARARLSALPTHAIETALESLLQDKMIIERHKTRILSERDYEMSDLFEKRLRTNMPPTQFYRAYAFKSQLDQAFETDGRVRWNHLAHDGEVMAVLNLAAHRRMTIIPINPPLNKWGHTGDGYATRQMDKSKLNFDMDLVPTSTYIAGKPLEPLPEPPAPHLKATSWCPRKIPIWYDINDDFVPTMWKHTLAAVLGLLAVRSGANAAELQATVKPAIDAWEVEEVLKWLVKANVADQVGAKGYTLKEWWWMAVES